MTHLPTIKASKYRVYSQVREVHKVIQWKEGCVFRTRSMGMIVCSPEYAASLIYTSKGDIQVGPVSTRVSRYLSSL